VARDTRRLSRLHSLCIDAYKSKSTPFANLEVSASVLKSMTVNTEHDQVLQLMVAELAARLQMMDMQISLVAANYNAAILWSTVVSTGALRDTCHDN
jgi:hypothetical protein